jgi:hypothetical protein
MDLDTNGVTFNQHVEDDHCCAGLALSLRNRLRRSWIYEHWRREPGFAIFEPSVTSQEYVSSANVQDGYKIAQLSISTAGR